MQAGDIVLVETDHLMSKAIRFGQGLRFRKDKRPYARWNHVALVLNKNGDIIEALISGVTKSNLSKYPVGTYQVISTHSSTEDTQQILAFAHSVLAERWRYGFLTIASLVLTILTGSKFVFGKIGTAICSGLVCAAMTRKGEIFSRPPDYMMPADVAEHFLSPSKPF